MIGSIRYRCLLVALSLCALLGAAGCSTTTGTFVPQRQFVYPNSNVEALGPTKSRVSHTYFFLFAKPISIQDAKSAYNDALAKVGGANVLIDYKEDVTITEYPLFIKLSYALEGQAAKMDVGRKELHP